ncbi:MAG: hypothetical protein J0H73_06540 [Salana multivorans]|uniref:hypothetical protein n=1 Tax=Salana multivorans TaxID=120377 RepID=UPI000965CA02|nr:hypothetical protein [Salana multivorans]MBN8881956.1 hypothetical protein [Salana multivorans]OJX97348.1 MAG: hypothetical protein BGO96_05280 [Micrococcales bacterium 73-15]
MAFTGKGKAAENVYQGKRIVKVCFWYTRGSATVTQTWCSSANSNGSSWVAGPEVVGGTWDIAYPWAAHTVFNISTTRIDPKIY